jgi:hypothetical protein
MTLADDILESVGLRDWRSGPVGLESPTDSPGGVIRVDQSAERGATDV